MGLFAGGYGDERRAAAVGRLYGAMVDQSTVVVRRLGGDRGGEVSAHRVLSSPRVTPAATVGCLARGTSQAAAGLRVVVAQDTTEVSFPGRAFRSGPGSGPGSGLGPAGRAGGSPGFFIHAAVAVDADTDDVLGLVDAQLWTREAGAAPGDAPGVRGAGHKRRLAEKESRRWLAGAQAAAERLAGAAEVVVVGDRESDIYPLFARRPASAHLLVRAAQNRATASGTPLFDAPAAWPVMRRHLVHVPASRPGAGARDAQVTLRAGAVTLRRPRHGRREGDPDSLALSLVEVAEADPPPGAAPLHWRLLTTLPAGTCAEALEAVRLYGLRWRVEQTFRMLKSDGLQLDEAQTMDPHRLTNLAALATGAAVRIIQLVDARDGSARPASDVASPEQLQAAEALGPTLEGRTDRQKNPHPPASLAWLSWVTARLGGWNCYGKPPGPKTMRAGWNRLAAIAQGYALAQTTTHDACIP
jgi:hypothetical protein